MTPLVDDHMAVYFRNVYDHIVRISEAIETNRDLLSNVLDAHFSIVSNRTNEIMKSLTLLSAIFLPLTFVTGFFGMNFEHLPFKSDALMWAAVACCLLLPSAMLLWFRSRRWM
jgi:magnesium transporter